MEDALQRHINRLPLGERLHRHVAMGSNMEDHDAHEESYLCKTFLTYAPRSAIRTLCTINL